MECRQCEIGSRKQVGILETSNHRILNPRSSPFVRLDPLLRLPNIPQRRPIDTCCRLECPSSTTRYSTTLSHARTTFSKILDSPFRHQTVQQTFRNEL